ncbi:methylenetetrahydrofolate reductase C-terminal domain-containing protein [Thermodesulfobacteriota bacterium]
MTRKASSGLLNSLYNPAEFTLTFELVPTRGGKSKEHTRALDLSRQLVEDGRLKAVSITENAGGHSALSPEVLGNEIRAMGLEVIVHFSCKDKNRNQMESILFAWDREGLNNLLVITGDYPKAGYRGHPKPVFDLCSVQALDLVSRLNRGIFGDKQTRSRTCSPRPTSFVSGVAVSPFKKFEAELMMQYYKLHRKIIAGADYVITQVGFDARKFQEVLVYLRKNGLDIPVMGNVFIPNRAVTELMYRGEVPGCVIPEKLYSIIQQEAKSPDKGLKARLVRAAKLLSILKGLGFSGAHLGGPGLTFADLDFVFSRAEEYDADWQSLIPEFAYWYPDGCYLFEKDVDTGLNTSSPKACGKRAFAVNFSYESSKFIHDTLFEKHGMMCKPMKNFCLQMEEKGLGQALNRVEHISKFLLFGCRNCGDCTLADLAYLCPQSGCAKYLLNGPCGGSREGWCEVYPGKKRCHFVRVYERLATRNQEGSMAQGFVPPRDWSLNNSSSWINFFSGNVKRIGINKKNLITTKLQLMFSPSFPRRSVIPAQAGIQANS